MDRCRILALLAVLSVLESVASSDARISVSSDGNLVWEDSGKPAFLVSTTAKWANFRMKKFQRKRAEKAARMFPSHAWIYGEANTIAKMRRMGFNAMNPFALPTGYLPLLPGYRSGLTPEEDFEQLVRLRREFGWDRRGVIGYLPQTPEEWTPCLREMRALTNMPFYIDLYTSRPSQLSRQAKIVGERLDVERLFYPGAGKGFSQTFRLTSEPGRAALTALYVKDAETYRALGVKPFAYKLLNEPCYSDDSKEFNDLLSALTKERFGDRKLSGVARTVEKQKLRERLMADAMRDVRAALRRVEPGTPTFVQVHSEAWRKNWNGIDLYRMNRDMDIVSIGTGGYCYDQPERGGRPSPALADMFGRYAFYRAQARGKPLVASEGYFGGMGFDRTPWLEKMLWYQAAEGVSLVNLWEWVHPNAEKPTVSFSLANALGCRPETWDSLPRLVRQLNELSDFFPVGVRHEKTHVACLYSQPSQRFAPERIDAWCAAVAALELNQVRADAIFEEQLAPGEDCRIGDYDVIVAAGVDEVLPRTREFLRRWMDAGGRLLVVDATLDRDEYGERLSPEVPDVLGHRNCLRVEAMMSESSSANALLECLAQAGIRPFVKVTDVATGTHPAFIRVVRAGNAEGLTGWFVANYSETSRLLELEAAELCGVTAVQPFGTNAWPVVDGRMTVLVPAQFHALAVTGPAQALAARFGARREASLARLKAESAAAVAADRARAPKRASVPVDIRSVANGGFDNMQGWADGTVWKDGHGCDLVGVPFHVQTFRHVDFDIIRFDFNRNRTTIALASRCRPSGLKRTPPIPIGGKVCRSLAFLGAAVHARRDETAATLEVRYVDGTSVLVPLRVGHELGNWMVAENDRELQANCVWQSKGKGFFFYEWLNPRPGVALESFSLLGGEDGSAANVIAVSALETRFTKVFANRLSLSEGEVLRRPGSARFRLDGQGLSLGGEILERGVLRYLVRQPPQSDGEVQQFARAIASAGGCDANGMKCAADPHCATVAGRCHVMCARASVVTADEWAEVEVPLSEICKGVDANGRTVPLSVLKCISLSGQPKFEYRDVRLEY